MTLDKVLCMFVVTASSLCFRLGPRKFETANRVKLLCRGSISSAVGSFLSGQVSLVESPDNRKFTN